MYWKDMTLQEIAQTRFVKKIDIYNNKIYLWFMQQPEKVDQVAVDLGWSNAFLGNKINSSRYQHTS